jgi:membrane carboxypeptidase/penicillin-binding protein
MEGVVQGGTAIAVKEVGKPIAGKTGTTNEAKDAWFIGFSPDIVVGIYLGYDKPRPLGKGNAATGGHLAAPIARDFLKLALADKPATPFKIPAGIKLIRVDAKTGMRAGPGDSGRTILEATATARRRSKLLPARDRRAVLKPEPDCALRLPPLHQAELSLRITSEPCTRERHARRSRTSRRRDQAVSRAAEEASLTSKNPPRGSRS